MPRPLGARNKPREALHRHLREKFGADWDPLIKMAEHANEMAERIDEESKIDDLRQVVDAFEKITKYIHPALKSVDVDLSPTMEGGNPTNIRLVAVYDSPEAPEKPVIEHKADTLAVGPHQLNVAQNATQDP